MPKQPTSRQLVANLQPRQQTLEFAKSRLWEQLRQSDQLACRDALAILLVQITQSTRENRKDERKDQ